MARHPKFRYVVQAIVQRPEGFLLPVDRYGRRFETEAAERGLRIDQISFEIVRDLATDLLVVNWRTEASMTGRYEVVYPAGLESGETSRTVIEGYSPPQYVVWGTDGLLPGFEPTWSFRGNVVEPNVFEQTLWREYLVLTDRVPRFPVLYPQLRDSTCVRLQIPDLEFDAIIKALIQTPRRLVIYPTEGLLSYSNKTPITYKQVPPRTASGQFMTFLKIDKVAVR